MKQAHKELVVTTRGRGFVEITREAQEFVEKAGVLEGLLTVFLRHTSASLLIQENADPEVRRDLERFFARLIPDGDEVFRHTCEGPDDMPAHGRSAITSVSLGIPVVRGELALGTWQGIYLWEHRHEPHRRAVVFHVMGVEGGGR